MATLFQVSTVFWWDNFDRNIETTSGAGSIHTTPGIAFQEDSAAVVVRQEEISIPKSKRRSIEISGENVRKRVAVNSKAEHHLLKLRLAPLFQMLNFCVKSRFYFGSMCDI